MMYRESDRLMMMMMYRGSHSKHDGYREITDSQQFVNHIKLSLVQTKAAKLLLLMRKR